MDMIARERRINKLNKLVAAKKAGFAIFKMMVCIWSGEVKIVQTSKNANMIKVGLKHQAFEMESLISDEDLASHYDEIEIDEIEDYEIVFAMAAEMSSTYRPIDTKSAELIRWHVADGAKRSKAIYNVC